MLQPAGGLGGSWRSCAGVPEFAGEFLFQHNRVRYLIVTCAAHRSVVPGSHPITGEERAGSSTGGSRSAGAGGTARSRRPPDLLIGWALASPICVVRHGTCRDTMSGS